MARHLCVDALAFVSWVVLTFPCACGGNTSYDNCATAAGGGSSLDVGLGIAGNSTGGSTAVYSPLTHCRFDYPELAACGLGFAGWVETERVNVLLVIERSSRMSEPHPSGNGLSQWDTLITALGASLTQVERDSREIVSLGLELFPYDPTRPITIQDADPTEACKVPSGSSAILVNITSGSAKLSDIFDVLSSQTPAGYTPTAEALHQALEYFTSGDGKNVPGYWSVLLASSGAGNCNQTLDCTADTCTVNPDIACSSTVSCCDGAGYLCADDAAVVDAISKLASAGIHTFVVGTMPNAHLNRTALNAYANAGKMPNDSSASGDTFYSVTDTSAISDLVDAFGNVTAAKVHTCDVELFQTPADSVSIKVFMDCVPVYETSPDAGIGGWTLDTSQSPAHLKFLGSTCDTIMNHGASEIDIVSSCPLVSN